MREEWRQDCTRTCIGYRSWRNKTRKQLWEALAETGRRQGARATKKILSLNTNTSVSSSWYDSVNMRTSPAAQELASIISDASLA